MVDLESLPPFADGDHLHVVVESPRGSAIKLKYDRTLGAMTLNRPLVAGLTYPFDWGFVPGTRAEDGDPVDAMVFWDVATYPGVVIVCRALGVVRVEQNRADGRGRERNDRILAVPVAAPRETRSRIAELPERVRQELEEFFRMAVLFRGKDATFLGWGEADEALALVRRSIA